MAVFLNANDKDGSTAQNIKHHRNTHNLTIVCVCSGYNNKRYFDTVNSFLQNLLFNVSYSSSIRIFDFNNSIV